ncbi:response regulator [Marinicella litoralis]|uniref:LuxR family two component transcriptional regulator n=1 Tax=Marinicella litoralis TaxID=644220 RepID=A0A4R6XMA0_9GAMM|nr:response regulator [Marinicella litoralis]TDR19489.1 LuxR family two component transcriptional regulator [Marinicella litoralis]
MIKVLLVDDHDIVRIGIRMVIEKMPGIKIVGESNDGYQAIEQVQSLKPDVVLMDVNMPRMSGLEATRKITEMDKYVRIIILTIHAENPYPKQMLDAGANGYLTKGCAALELEEAIKKVYGGQKYVGADIAQQMALSMLPGGKKDSPFDILTGRELEVMMLLVRGKKAKEIGVILGLNDKTVATYKYRILEKLELQNEVKLTHMAIRHGILEADEIGVLN